MKWLTLTALTTVLGLAAFGSWACNDDGDELTLQEYFDRIDQIDNDGTVKTDAVFEGVDENSDAAAVREAFTRFPDVIDEILGELEDVDPPDEVKQAHEALEEKLRAVSTTARDSLDEINGAQSMDELGAVLAGEGFVAANEAFTAACLDLQQLADDNSIAVVLDCGEEEEAASQEAGEVLGAQDAPPAADNRCHPTGC
jgi:hypothetical protein